MTKSHLPKNGLRCNIITNYQCSNGGISSRSTSVLVIDPEQGTEHLTPEQLAIAVQIGTAGHGAHLRPAVACPAGNIGYMAGGSYVVGDSRLSQEIERVTGIRFYGAVALHDRTETPAQYSALSD